MSPQQSVLIVDESSESREVLRTVLERGGTRILEATKPQQGLEMARRLHPDLIVLDLETEPADAAAGWAGDFEKTAQTRQTPIVVLATARCQAARLPRGEFISKPYQYGPLIRRIEHLLGRT